MLRIEDTLPDAALLNGAGQELARNVAASGGIWFDASPEWLDLDEAGAVASWRPRVGEDPAQPAQPNRANARPEAGGIRATAGSNCGFWLPGAAANAADFSFAILFRPAGGDMMTALTLNLSDAKNYLFLSQAPDGVTFKSQSGSASVTLPLPAHGAARLLVAGFSGGQHHLRVGGVTRVSSAPPDRTIAGPADLFIACRSNREGLAKTLGDGIIASVILWPHNILAKDGAALAALEDWRFWEG